MSVSIVLGFMIVVAKIHYFSQLFFFLGKNLKKKVKKG